MTRARYTVLYLTLALSVITYLDRVAIASAATSIRGELGLSAVEMGWVFSAFTFAYAAFEIPSGWMGDVIGPRKVLTRIVLWWSAFTMATGLAWNFVTLIVARFLFGVGEAGAFPNISRSYARWFPAAERGSAHGVVFMGTRLGGAIAPPLVVLLTSLIGWRQTFFVLGAIGVFWCVVWWRWFRDEPAAHPAVNEAELRHIERGLEQSESLPFKWSELLSPNLLLICLMYFCMGYTLYFNLTWLPTYLQEVRGFTIGQAGVLAGIVLFTGAMATMAGGRITDVLVRRYGLKVGRSIGVVTLPVSALLLIAAALVESPVLAAILLAATLGVADLCVSACWSMCHDVGGKNAGIVTGAMNTFGNIGGAISPLVVGYAVEWWSSWTLPFFITAGVYVMGGVFTLIVNPRRRLMQPAPAAPHLPVVPVTTIALVLACGSMLIAQGKPAPPRPERKQVLAWADIRNGTQHDSVTRALVTIERLGRESGAYDTYIRTDSQLITKQPITVPGNARPITNKNLDYFDAIFFIGLREIDLSAQQKADLLAFVKEDGKGFVAAHTATTAFFSWPEFGEMLGGRFDEHPWNVTDATVIVEDPQFPAMRHFPLRSVVRDEHYQIKDFSRESIRVLARLDPASIDLKNPRVHRTDGDFPVAWAKTYGKGKVFYSALGHGPEMWDNPLVHTMYFEAMKWALGLVPGDATPRPLPTAAEWPSHGGDPGARRYSPLKQITPQNVTSLREAWTFDVGSPNLQVTPLVIDGRMYVSGGSTIFALEPERGTAIWKYEAPGPVSRRGVAYWPGDGTTTARIFSGAGDRLVALDAKTGTPVPSFGENGYIDLTTSIRGDVDGRFRLVSPPAIYKNLVITGGNNGEQSPSGGLYGDIRAWDAHTGKLVWSFHTVPRPGEPGVESWEGDSWKDRSGTNVWAFFTVDVERGLVFAPIGSPTSDYYGADRKGMNLYGNSIVALDASSGRLRWYRQLVHHDLWDFDLPAAPTLIDVTRGGKQIPAVAVLTKVTQLFIFDRVTGEPIFGIEERPVPQSTVPGEASWPTQPFPLRPPPLGRIDFDPAKDFYTATPEHAAFCKTLWDENAMYTKGLFTPPGLDGMMVTFPSTLGGGNWNGLSYDPGLGLVFTNVMNLGQVAGMEFREDRSGRKTYVRRTPWGGSAGRFWNPETKIPCSAPPFGELVAVDVNRGEIAWKVPFGVVDELQARGVPQTGTLNIGGTIATASGLLFAGATVDGRFRAFESTTGRVLWETKLDASAHSIPMTFMGKDNRQYVVVAAGGGSYLGSPPGTTIVAFALPRAR